MERSRKRKGSRDRVSKQKEGCCEETTLLNKLSEMVTTAMSPLIERLEVLERNSSVPIVMPPRATVEITSEKQASGYESTQNTVVMIPPPTRPEFSGHGNHPVAFVEEFDKYVRKMNIEQSDVGAALECLKGDARNWSRIYVDKWQNLETLKIKKDFLEQYWGREAQNRVKRKIGCGRWNVYGNKAMSDYFSELFSEAKRLTSYSSEDVVADEIMQHFPQEIRRLWVTTGATGARAAVKFLKNIEGVSEVPRRQQLGPTRNSNIASTSVIESVRRDYQQQWRPERPGQRTESTVDKEAGGPTEMSNGEN